MSSRSDLVQEIRRFIPLRTSLGIARRRVEALWKNDEFRAAQVDNMRFLLENTDRADEIPALAREYAVFDIERNYRRWHPRHLVRQPVRGVEWLTTKRDPKRGVVLSFMHHGHYAGLPGSLARAGIKLHSVVAPDAFDPKAPIQIRQHYKVCAMAPGCVLVNAGDGAARLAGYLEQGEILVIATDVAGRTPITFLGREMLGSFGAARFAIDTNSPVVLITSHQEADGSSYFQLHEPIEPSDFADSSALLNEILRRHEPAVLAWPEAYESPYGRLAIPSQAAGPAQA